MKTLRSERQQRQSKQKNKRWPRWLRGIFLIRWLFILAPIASRIWRCVLFVKNLFDG